MSPVEVRYRRSEVWKALVFFYVGFIVLYFMVDLPLLFWIIAAGVIVALVFTVGRAHSPEPILVINDEGVFDERLRVGVIGWADIRRIRGYRRSGAYYISLELHNQSTYQSRRPLWLKTWAAWRRPSGMSPIAISANGLDIDYDTLVEKLHEGCMTEALKKSTVRTYEKS